MPMNYFQNLTPIPVLASKNTQKNQIIEQYFFTKIFPISEAAVQRCSVKKVFLENSQNSQENTCVRGIFHRPYLVAASVSFQL